MPQALLGSNNSFVMVLSVQYEKLVYEGILGVLGFYEDVEELCHWLKYGDMNL